MKKLGGDRVHQSGTGLIVISRADMHHWQVRPYRRLAIHFEGGIFHVSSRERQADGWYRYILSPWPEDEHDLPGGTIVYDDAYVAERDRALRLTKRAVIFYWILFPLIPLLGFLWSGTKTRLRDSLGLEPIRMTSLSIYLEYLAIVCLLAVILITLFAPTGFNMLHMIVVVCLLFPDALMRWDSLMREQSLPGFYEWLFR